MHPTIVSIPIGHDFLGIHTYGLMVGIGFALAIWRLAWRGRSQGFDRGKVLDFAFWSLVAGVGGSRVAFVIVNARAFWQACFDPVGTGGGDHQFAGCLAPLRFWEGGLVFYGGALAAGAVAVWFCRRERWSFARFADVAAPSLSLGHVFGRLGCLFAGCCFGAPCAAPWGLTFPRGSVAFDELHATGVLAWSAERTLPLHPTQLYEALGELAIFVLLVAMERRADRGARARMSGGPSRPGHIVLVYVAAYAVLRFLVEIFRGDAARGHVFSWTAAPLARALGLPEGQPILLSTSQLVSLLVVAAAGIATLYRRRAYAARH